jgi:hypothetical protein
MPDPTPKHVAVKEERSELLHNVTKETEKVMVALAIVWIGLTITDIVGKLSPSLQTLNNAIWALFGLDFAVKFAIAPHKLALISPSQVDEHSWPGKITCSSSATLNRTGTYFPGWQHRIS